MKITPPFDSSLEILWVTYTPTIIGSITNPTLATAKTLIGRYRVVGNALSLAVSYYAAASTGAANGSGAYKFSLPTGINIDTSVATIEANPLCVANNKCGFAASIFGFGFAGNANSVAPSFVIGSSLTTVCLAATQSSNSSDVDTVIGSAAYPIAASTGVYYKFTAEIPIVIV